MKRISIPFLRKKGNCWYWEPSAAARKLGFKGVSLGSDDAKAAIEAGKLWQAYNEKRKGAVTVYEGSFNHLRDVYYHTREWLRLADESKRDYKRYIEKVICAKWGTDPVAAIDGDIVEALHETFADRPYAGNQCIKVLSTLLELAIKKKATFNLEANPCDQITLYGVKEGVTSRERVWEDGEIASFDDAADAELGIARLLFSYTGQRTGDVLAMQETDYKTDEKGERWLHVAQHKTGTRLWIYCHADLIPALDAHIERHQAERPNRIGAPLIQNTKGDFFNRRVFVARWDRTAVKAGVVTLAEGKGKRRGRENPTRHDLRRTAVTRLAEAGCNDEQISSITGLSRSMIERQVYNVRTKEHARAGIKKLEDYRR